MEDLKLLKDYMDDKAIGCVFTFLFDIDEKNDETGWHHQYSCCSSEDFVKRYGTLKEHILTDYYVRKVNTIHSSNDQGIDEVLVLVEKRKWDVENKPTTYDPEQARWIREYLKASYDVLAGEAMIIDCGSGWNYMIEMTERLNKLSDSDKNKIRSIFLGYKYREKK